jgi:VWFA-related protein
MFRFVSLLASAAFLCLVMATAFSQSAPPPAAPAVEPQKADNEQVVKIRSTEVLLDLIVRDKKGEVIRDLKPEEIEVYEDGSKQPISAVRLREFTGGISPRESGEKDNSEPRKPTFDPSRPLMLVSLVFENLDLNGRDLVRRYAMNFVDNALYDNVFIGVFASGPRLFLIQQYTNDRGKLQQAIDRVADRAEKPWEKFAEVSNQALNTLGTQIVTGDPAGFSATGRGPGIARLGADDPQSPAAGAGAQAPVIDTSIYLARMTLNIYRALEITQREEQARMAIYPLLQMIREQKKLPGRKTIVYFSNGFAVPTGLVPAYHQALSEANRANVSIYTVDSRGLSVESDTAAGLREQQLAIRQSEEMRSSGRAISSDAFTAFDTAQDGTRLNKQQTLREAAESTGGFLVTSTNNLATPLRRIAAELSSYYEVYYEPTSQKLDGKFRKITVKILRPGVKVQTRNGYFATPPVEEKNLTEAALPAAVSSEKVLSDTLNAESLPQTFAHRTLPLRFASGKDSRAHQICPKPMMPEKLDILPACRSKAFSPAITNCAPLSHRETFRRRNAAHLH